MSDRFRSDINYLFNGVPYIFVWTSGNKTGLSMGVKTDLTRNVHLTIYFRENILNTHITDDDGTNKRKVWEKKMSVDEIKEIGIGLMDELLSEYSKEQEYFQLSSILTNKITTNQFSFERKMNNYDITNFIDEFLEDNSLVQKKIIDGFKEGHKPGLLIEDEDTFLVIPFDDSKIFKMNTDIRKTPFFQFPTVEGLCEYFDYLDREGIIEKSKRYDQKHWERMQAAMIGFLNERGFEYEGQDE
jgi:hypothetical protein